MPEDYPQFSDFAEDMKIMEGDKKRIEDVLNVKILIKSFKIRDSKWNDDDYITIQFLQDGEKYIFFTGSKILIDQLRKYEDKLPFYTVIKKIDKYYTLT